MNAKICGCKDCEKPVIALGMCSKHLRRTRLYGSPFVLKSHAGMMYGLSAIERFNKQHRKDGQNGCWEWTACKERDGYGRFKGMVGTVVYNKAHRFSWAYHSNSEIPPGMMVCHSCDNPGCVNPGHLWLGSAKENVNDMDFKRRRNARLGELSARAVLTEAQVRSILADCRPYAQIAQEFGVTTMTVSDIKCRRSWSHLQVDVIGHAPRVSPKRGKSDRITAEIVREIRASPDSGKSLAAKYAVSPQLICAIRKRRAWQHIQE
jgi:hypothetical protein